ARRAARQGCSHGISPDTGVLGRLSRASRQALVAILYSHALSEDRPANVARPRHARSTAGARSRREDLPRPRLRPPEEVEVGGRGASGVIKQRRLPAARLTSKNERGSLATAHPFEKSVQLAHSFCRPTSAGGDFEPSRKSAVRVNRASLSKQ